MRYGWIHRALPADKSGLRRSTRAVKSFHPGLCGDVASERGQLIPMQRRFIILRDVFAVFVHQANRNFVGRFGLEMWRDL